MDDSGRDGHSTPLLEDPAPPPTVDHIPVEQPADSAPVSDRAGEAEADSDSDDDDEIMSMEDSAAMVMSVVKPVALTLLIVAVLVRVASPPAQVGRTIASLAYSEASGDSTSTKLVGSLLNALAFVAFIIVMTMVLFLLYKYGCMKIVIGWLLFITWFTFASFGGIVLVMVCNARGWPLDYFTLGLFSWNYSIVGAVAIFYHGPQRFEQGYLICVGVLMGFFFTRLPEWTCLTLLAAIALYDVFAVLCPKGPLHLLIAEAQEKQEPLPALLYNASVVMTMAKETLTGTKSGSKSSQHSVEDDVRHRVYRDDDSDDEREDAALERDEADVADRASRMVELGSMGGGAVDGDGGRAAVAAEAGEQRLQGVERPDFKERRSIKLGLGDFVFYSVLIGRAAKVDIITVFTCFIAVLTGLYATLLLLAVLKKALPALPISIGLGLLFYLITKTTLVPFVLENGEKMVML